ncbi:MAG: hypothetical protein NTW87_19630 [Planctomycetota bacterium]|nr:hypothetical protein [Planctomycetota bacterium]
MRKQRNGSNAAIEERLAKCYRRIVLDMHIPDWHPELLAQFDPETVGEQLVRGRVSYATIYAQSSIGLCHWPTRVGRPHAAMRGRDFFGDLLNAVRRRGKPEPVPRLTEAPVS